MVHSEFNVCRDDARHPPQTPLGSQRDPYMRTDGVAAEPDQFSGRLELLGTTSDQREWAETKVSCEVDRNFATSTTGRGKTAQ